MSRVLVRNGEVDESESWNARSGTSTLEYVVPFERHQQQAITLVLNRKPLIFGSLPPYSNFSAIVRSRTAAQR
jgi:hypothetical protein